MFACACVCESEREREKERTRGHQGLLLPSNLVHVDQPRPLSVAMCELPRWGPGPGAKPVHQRHRREEQQHGGAGALDPRDPLLQSERTQGFAADPVYVKGEVFACVGLSQNLKDLKGDAARRGIPSRCMAFRQRFFEELGEIS